MKICVFVMFFLMAAATVSETKITSRESKPECWKIVYMPFNMKQRVCGSDGITYLSRKHILYKNCVENTGISAAKDGWCDDKKEMGELVTNLLTSIAVDILKQFTDEMGDGGFDHLPISLLEMMASLDSSEKDFDFFSGGWSGEGSGNSLDNDDDDYVD